MQLPNLTYRGVPVWRHAQVLQWTAQIVSGILVVVLVTWFFANIASAISNRNIPFGFGVSLPGVPDANRLAPAPVRVFRHLPLRLHSRGNQHPVCFLGRRSPGNPPGYLHRNCSPLRQLDRLQGCPRLHRVLPECASTCAAVLLVLYSACAAQRAGRLRPCRSPVPEQCRAVHSMARCEQRWFRRDLAWTGSCWHHCRHTRFVAGYCSGKCVPDRRRTPC